jgi:hypothetical protein
LGRLRAHWPKAKITLRQGNIAEIEKVQQFQGLLQAKFPR